MMRKIHFFSISFLLLYSQTTVAQIIPTCDVQSQPNNIISSDCRGADWISGNLTIENGVTISSGSGAAGVTVNNSFVGILDNSGGRISSGTAGILAAFGSSISEIINRDSGRISVIEPMSGTGLFAGGILNLQASIGIVRNNFGAEIKSETSGHAINFGIANTNGIVFGPYNSSIGPIENLGRIRAIADADPGNGLINAAIGNGYLSLALASGNATATNTIDSILNRGEIYAHGDNFQISAGILNGGYSPVMSGSLDLSINRINLIENYSSIRGRTLGGFFGVGIFNGTFSGFEVVNPNGYNIGVLNNKADGIIEGYGSSLGIGILNAGVISEIQNDGQISGGSISTPIGIWNWSSIQKLSNGLGGQINAGILNFSGGGGSPAIITNLNNSGIIQNSGTSFAIHNASGNVINNLTNESTGLIINGIGNGSGSTINYLTNLGEIQAGIGGYGIVNVGTIGELNNAQGGTQPLTYSGPLPTNYNVIIYGASSYGKLEVTSPGFSQTRFGIYGGSLLSNGTYSSVLKGITRGNLYAVTGTYGSATWSLINSSGTIWDLLISGIVTGPSAANTQQSLTNSASVLQGTFTLQNSVMVNGFTYDCPVFDKHGICVSAGGRNTTVQAQGINNTSGLLIASYRLNQNNSRIGAWVDQNLSVRGPGTVKLGNSTPMIGLFGVWSQRSDGVGAEVKVSAAYGQKDTTITRQIVGSGATASEAGSGGSQLISQGAQVVAKYGFAVLPDVVVSPYAGVRYTQNNMGGYTEATSSAVTAPLTYSALNTNATTALAGAEARYRGIPKTTLFASAGVETDTNTSNGSYSATGITGLTPVNFNPNPVKTRPTATVGGYYDILKNQRIGVTGIYRQEPFQAVSTTTVLATYTIGL